MEREIIDYLDQHIILESFSTKSQKLSSLSHEMFQLNNSDRETDAITYIYAGGTIENISALNMTIQPIDYYTILLIQKGKCRINQKFINQNLEENDLIFLNKNSLLSIQSVSEPFCFKLFIADGDLLSYAYHKFHQEQTNPYLIYPKCSAYVLSNILQIEYLLKNYHSQRNIIIHKITNDIICNLIYSKSSNTSTTYVPSHVTKAKCYLEENYMDLLSLDTLADELHINKYKLCRDFSKTIGVSPMKYLNQLRIEKAKALLLETDFKIHKVGEIVGIDNTTHFINQFKKTTGLTPMVYKKINSQFYS